MKTSAAGVNFIASWEKFAAKPYRDSGGVWTIGYGHAMFNGITIPSLTLAAGTALFVTDLSTTEAAVARMVKASITQAQFDALVSIVFNCGETGIKNSTLMRKFNAGDTTGAGAEFRRWNRDNGLGKR